MACKGKSNEGCFISVRAKPISSGYRFCTAQEFRKRNFLFVTISWLPMCNLLVFKEYLKFSGITALSHSPNTR